MNDLKTTLLARDLDPVFSRCRPEDFDGHTVFRDLSSEQRLDALIGMQAFVREFKGLARRPWAPPGRLDNARARAS